jgi:hypothetical protein
LLTLARGGAGNNVNLAESYFKAIEARYDSLNSALGEGERVLIQYLRRTGEVVDLDNVHLSQDAGTLVFEGHNEAGAPSEITVQPQGLELAMKIDKVVGTKANIGFVKRQPRSDWPRGWW